MLYHSTRGGGQAVDSARAVLEGLAPDGGLYMPEKLPEFDWKACLKGSAQEMSTAIRSAAGDPRYARFGRQGLHRQI